MGNAAPKTEPNLSASCCAGACDKLALPAKLNISSLLDDFLKIVGDVSPLPSLSDQAAVKVTVQKVAGDLVDLIYDQLNAPATPSSQPQLVAHTDLTAMLVQKATAAQAVASVNVAGLLAWVIQNASTIIALITSIVHVFAPAQTA